MPVAWRICRARHALASLEGTGAKTFGGRWNDKGLPVVYASNTLSLAAMELLVHTDTDLAPPDLVSVKLRYPDSVSVEEFKESDLPANWRDTPAPLICTDKGSAGIKSQPSLVLRVPSAIVPQETNVLFNPDHPEIADVSIDEVKPFTFDPRLF